ncbi:adenylate/guanylate cyclase domain-containing protein [Smaragdicoccus niigatensis]|uniref:adenylate/guanylate cyclase domain-containing protein n=1 Tax=Smaragdicoccus niigatensis TaxID=359359 RepID=UPI00036BBE53|nr:adenylate/guanylate cyclase domain-containing protein [Smaragdicoccus niigatensis]
MIDRLARWALRSPAGFTAIAILCGLGGFVVVMIELWLTGVLQRTGSNLGAVLAFTFGYVGIGIIIGPFVAWRMQQRGLTWWRAGRPPTKGEARRVLRLPFKMAVLSASLWIPGTILEAALSIAFGYTDVLFTTMQLILAGGLASCAFAYLAMDRALRPAVPVLASVIPVRDRSLSALARVGITWALASGLPILSVILVLTDRVAAPDDKMRGALVICAGAILFGLVATLAFAKSVAVPLRELEEAIGRITAGDLDVSVPVEFTSEVGVLQASVNDMTESLRERERVRNVFDRHVGIDVAERALAAGSSLNESAMTGELCEVTALFVDIVGSTELAHKIPPQLFVEKINRLLATVVDATEDNCGLVNKFEGDAALCIFGAPIQLDNDAEAALQTALRIRDEVLATGELDIGIGLSRGTVFAGDVGSKKRLEFTVIGDPVNEAARLTEAAKGVRQRILASESVIAAAPSMREKWMRYETIHLRGRPVETKTWTDRRGYPPLRYGSRSRQP